MGGRYRLVTKPATEFRVCGYRVARLTRSVSLQLPLHLCRLDFSCDGNRWQSSGVLAQAWKVAAQYGDYVARVDLCAGGENPSIDPLNNR